MKDADKDKVTAERERKKKVKTGKGIKGKDLQEKGFRPIISDRRHPGHEKVCGGAYLQEG